MLTLQMIVACDGSLLTEGFWEHVVSVSLVSLESISPRKSSTTHMIGPV